MRNSNKSEIIKPMYFMAIIGFSLVLIEIYGCKMLTSAPLYRDSEDTVKAPHDSVIRNPPVTYIHDTGILIGKWNRNESTGIGTNHSTSHLESFIFSNSGKIEHENLAEGFIPMSYYSGSWSLEGDTIRLAYSKCFYTNPGVLAAIECTEFQNQGKLFWEKDYLIEPGTGNIYKSAQPDDTNSVFRKYYLK